MPHGPSRTLACHRVAGACCSGLLLFQLVLPARTAVAHPTHPGKWSVVPMDLNGTAVNLMLLPGWSPTYHSRVLWWDHDTEGAVAGDVLGWNAPNDAATNSGTFPTTSFIHEGLDDPPLLSNGAVSNLFCSSATQLGDGRLLVTGGTDVGESGSTSALLFDPAADVNGQWTRTDDMQYRRWYPDNVLLPNGKTLTASGSSYAHFLAVGGFADAAPDTQTRMLQRVGLARPGTVEPSVVPLENPLAEEPFEPISDAAAVLVKESRMLVYGGLNADQDLSSEAYLVSRHRNEFGADYFFRWSRVTQNATPGHSVPLKRVGATVLVLNKAGDDLLLIGGKEQFGPSSRVWRGTLSNVTITWTELSNVSSTPLPALHGHGAVYDAVTQRVFVFGGSENASEAATNATVYTIDLADSPTSTWMSVDAAVVSGPNLPPAAKSYASLTYVRYPRKGVPGDTALSRTRAMLFGGRTASGGYSDELWAMWIYGASEVRWELVPLDASPRPVARAKHAASLDENTLWLVVSGGETAAATATADVWTYDIYCRPSANCNLSGSLHWDAHPPMNLAVRGHAAVVIGPEVAVSRVPELFDPAAATGNHWTRLYDTPHWQEWFPFGFTAPRRPTDPAGADSFRVFYAGPEKNTPTLHLSRSTPNWSKMTADTVTFFAGGAVMHRPGKIMKAGTRDTGGSNASDVFGRTAVIDLKAATPSWVEAAPADQMISRRNHNLVILPNGEVLVVGGALYGPNTVSDDNNCVRMPQFWNPDTLTAGHWYGQERNAGGQFTMLFDSSHVRRHYHSTAVLMPDGRVLVAGGSGDLPDQRQADLYSPYYLFDAENNPRPRPVIQAAPTSVAYGERFPLCMSNTGPALAKLSLLRPGATTHGFDQNQRYVPLTVEAAPPGGFDGPRFLVTAPADSFDAPPGDYMLFALTASGTPSIASWIRLRATKGTTGHPTVVNNLAKICSQVSDGQATVQLQWLPPYGDSATASSCPGPATLYELRHKQGLMPGWSEFATASPAPGMPLPNDPVPGQPQTIEISGLTANTQYTFRLISKNHASGNGNWSALGNALTFYTYNEDCGGAGGGGGGGYEEGASARRVSDGYWLRRPGGGGGSDPHFLENTLFANAPTDVTTADVMRLPYGPAWTASGARVRLSRSGARGTRFSSVRLRGVALAPGQSAFVAGADSILTGTLVPPTGVIHADGRDLTESFAADSAFDGHEGDTLYVEFADDTPGRIAIETSHAQLVIPPSRTGLDVQCETSEGWRSVAHHDPRELRADALYSMSSSHRLRLVFLGEHRLHGVARFEPGAAAVVTTFEPTSLSHSRTGSLGSSLGADGVLVANGEHVIADFAVTSELGAELEWFLDVVGTHVALSGTGATSGRGTSGEAPPLRFALAQNRPNPFSSLTQIGFELPVRAQVRLEVFDLLGRRMATLVNRAYEPGRYSVSWDRLTTRGGRAAAGVYTCRFSAAGHQVLRRMILLP